MERKKLYILPTATLVDMGNFIQLMADDETLEYLEEGFKKLQAILFTCLYFYLFI